MSASPGACPEGSAADLRRAAAADHAAVLECGADGCGRRRGGHRHQRLLRPGTMVRERACAAGMRRTGAADDLLPAWPQLLPRPARRLGRIAPCACRPAVRAGCRDIDGPAPSRDADAGLARRAVARACSGRCRGRGRPTTPPTRPHARQAPPCARRTAGPSAPASAAGLPASGRCTGGSRGCRRTPRQ